MTAIDISVIVPCYNEENRITGLLQAVHDQTMNIKRMEVVIADGMSTDKTRTEINNFSSTHFNLAITVVDNPKRNIPSALNAAIRKAQGKYIVRLDAHSIPEKHYIENCIRHLDAQTAQNVGGVWIIRPGNNSQIAKAISIAASHPLGVGGAQYRDANTTADYVDTVPFGSYLRDYLFNIGLYDETLLSNEDYELNTRIRENGGKVYLDPKIRCEYFARENLRKLAKQYYRYGFWKFWMVKRYPGSIRLRQFLPPAFLLVLIFLLLTCFFLPVLFYAFVGLVILYFVSLFLGTYLVSNDKNQNFLSHLLTTIAITTMHFAWGTGFLSSPLIGVLRSNNHGK